MSDDSQWQGMSLQQQEQAHYEELQRLQQAKLEALQQALGNYGVYTYLDLNDLIDPDNKNWTDFTYRLPSSMVSPTESAERQGHIGFDRPAAYFINSIRNAETIDDVHKQSKLWNSYDPLSSRDNARKYFMFMVTGKNPSDGSRPANEPDSVQTTATTTTTAAGGTQGVQGTQGTQGVQAGAKPGNAVAGGGVQGSNNGSGGVQAGNGTLASAGIARGGTKTIGYDPYDPNPGNVSLAYAMRNAPEQERRTALINKWNQENGSTGYATGKGMLTSSSDGTYATGGGIKDANGNVLTNPGGDWEYQYALRDPQYGLGMMGKMSDAQRNYLQAVSDGMGYNYNFRGAPRYV